MSQHNKTVFLLLNWSYDRIGARGLKSTLHLLVVLTLTYLYITTAFLLSNWWYDRKLSSVNSFSNFYVVYWETHLVHWIGRMHYTWAKWGKFPTLFYIQTWDLDTKHFSKWCYCFKTYMRYVRLDPFVCLTMRYVPI